MTRAAFFDVDGTLTTGRVWRGIMHYFTQIQPKRITHNLFWAKHMPNWLLVKFKLRDSVDFRRAWATDLAWYYKGMSLDDSDVVNDWIVKHYVSQMLRTDSVNLVREHLKAGDLVMLVSSGPTALIRRIAAELEVPHAIGTDHAQADGHYTGSIAGPVCIAEYKASLAQAYLKAQGVEVDLPQSYAYADSASDRQLLEMVGYPVATYPDKTLLPIAESSGWGIFPEGYRGEQNGH